MASSSFRNSIIGAYGRKLKEEGIIDYDMSDEDPEFIDIVRQQLSKTVVKITGVSKDGFKATLSDFTFFPFSNPAIGSMSPQGEREAILNYRNNQEIMNKINEFLTLFNVEVDNIIKPRSDKDLQEYYDMALKNQGVEVESSVDSTPEPQVVETIVEKQPAIVGASASVTSASPSIPSQSTKKHVSDMSDSEIQKMLNTEINTAVNKTDNDELVLGTEEIPYEDDSIEFDTELGDEFFG